MTINDIRAAVLHGVMSVHAAVEPAEVDRCVDRVLAAAKDNWRNYAFTAGRNLGITALRHAEALKCMAAKAEEKAAQASRDQVRRDRLINEIIRLALTLEGTNQSGLLTLLEEGDGAATRMEISRDALYQRRLRAIRIVWNKASLELREVLDNNRSFLRRVQ